MYLFLIIFVEGQSVNNLFVQGEVPEMSNANGVRDMVLHARQEIRSLLLALRLRTSSSIQNLDGAIHVVGI